MASAAAPAAPAPLAVAAAVALIAALTVPPEQVTEASEATDKAAAVDTHTGMTGAAGTLVPAAGSTVQDSLALGVAAGMGVRGAARKVQGIRTAGQGRGRGKHRMGAHTSGVGAGTTPSAASKDKRSSVGVGRACTVAA